MRNSILFFVLVATFLSITGCNKNTPAIVTNTSGPDTPIPPPPPPPVPKDSSPPIAHAGSDVLVFLPEESCKLYGLVYSSRNGIESRRWRKISGPSSYKINSPDSLLTSIHDLTKGVYEFELTVTDSVGLTDLDTVAVTVGEMSSSREISIKNISWSSDGLLWGAGLTINIYSYIPVGSILKVFIRKDISAGWVEVVAYTSSGSENSWYIFFIDGSNLTVYSHYEESGTAEIMLVY